MANATGEAETGHLRLQFDRSVKVAFRSSSISSDGGLLLHRELDDAFGLTDMAADFVADPRTGRNGRHRLAGLLRQSIFSRLAGYEDVNDADRLCRDPVMRQLVGGRAVKAGAASASAMGRFETEMLTRLENLEALADLPGRWIDAVHDRRPPKTVRAACSMIRRRVPSFSTHAPNTEPEWACHRSGVPTDRRWMGRPSPEGRSRLTFDRSPVR